MALLNTYSQDVLKQELIEELKNIPELQSYFVNGENPIIDLFASKIASITAKKLFHINMVKNENFIQTAKNPDNKYYLAKSFGYRITRYKAPKIRVIYSDLANGTSPKSLSIKFGDVIGTYQDKDIIYIGDDKIIERGDEIDCAIGKINSHKDNFVFSDDDSLITLTIVPEFLKSVDDDAINMYVNGVKQELSKDLEDFIIKDRMVDYSDSNVASKIYVFEYSSLYGVRVYPEDIWEVKWVETDGLVDKIEPKDIKFNIDGQFRFKEILSFGSNCDSLEKLSWLPIMYYRTMRRAVTDDDYNYILRQLNYFKDISIFSKDVNTKYIFYIHERTDSYTIAKLTDYEADDVSNFINNYKMSGIKLYFIPGKPIDLKFDVTVKLSNPSKIEEVKTAIRNLLNNYILQFKGTVEMGDILSEISQIEIDGEKIITFIYPNEMQEKYELEQYEYLTLKDENFNVTVL